MRETLPLGRIAGVRVGLHWSVLVIVVLVTAMLAGGRFCDAHPGHSAWAYSALALLKAPAFFASPLAHELTHAVVARCNGVQVGGITLWLLGAALTGLPLRLDEPEPRAEPAPRGAQGRPVDRRRS